MKVIFFLSIFFISLQAHSQNVRKSDVTTMIATAIKPLQTTITSQATLITNLTTSKAAQDKLITALTARLVAAETKNTADSLFKIQQTAVNAGVKATVDSSLVQLDRYFIISGKVASINIPILAPQIKSYLEGKL